MGPGGLSGQPGVRGPMAEGQKECRAGCTFDRCIRAGAERHNEFHPWGFQQDNQHQTHEHGLVTCTPQTGPRCVNAFQGTARTAIPAQTTAIFGVKKGLRGEGVDGETPCMVGEEQEEGGHGFPICRPPLQRRSIQKVEINIQASERRVWRLSLTRSDPV